MEQNFINILNFPYEPKDEEVSMITKSNIEEENSNKSDYLDKSKPLIQENQLKSKDECSQEEEKSINIKNKEQNNFNLFKELELNNESYRKDGIEQNDKVQQKDSFI